MAKGIDKQTSPAFVSKERARLPSCRSQLVGLAGVCGVLSGWSHCITSAAKAATPFSDSYGAPEGAPFQSCHRAMILVLAAAAPHPFHSSIIFTKSLNR